MVDGIDGKSKDDREGTPRTCFGSPIMVAEHEREQLLLIHDVRDGVTWVPTDSRLVIGFELVLAR